MYSKNKFYARLLGLVMLLLLAVLLKAQAQNVGIGTTSPTQTLDVNGSLRVRALTGPGSRLLQADAAGNLSSGATTYPAAAAITPALASTTTGLNNPLVALSGTLAVVLNRGAGTLSLYDVSSPAAPVLRGTYSGLSPNTNANGTSLALSGTTAAVLNTTAGYPISVFTLGTGAPVLAATITMPAATSAQYGGVAMVGNMLYATSDHSGGGQGYFYVYDLSTPSSPILRNGAANSTTGFFTPTYIAAAGSLVCVSSPYGATAASDHFNVIDVSNSAAPVVVATNGGNTSANFTYKARPLAMANSVLCTLQPENNLLSTYDLSTPATPLLRHTFTTAATPVSVALNGTLAYVACQGSSTLQVIDISGSSAVLRGSVALDASANSVAVTSTLVLAANGSAANDLQVFNQPTRTIVVYPDGTAGSTTTPTGTDFIQNQTATAQAGGFNIGGSAVVGGTLAVGVLNNFGGGSTAAPLALSTKAASYLSLKPTTAGTDDYFQLPAASTCPGRIYYLCNVGSVPANLAAAGGSLVRAGTGAASSPFAMPTGSLGRTVIAISDGVNWTIGQLN